MDDTLQTKISILLFCIIVAILSIAFCYDQGILDDHTRIERDEEDLLIEKDGEIELSLNNAKFYSAYVALKDYTESVERQDGLSSFTYKERMGIAAMQIHKSDLKRTDKIFNETDGHKNYFYNLKNEKVIEILKRYFGTESYVNGEDLVDDMSHYNTNLTYPEGSKMIITGYDTQKSNYEVRFTGNKKKKDKFIENRVITSAKLKDDTITVKEKIIYYDKEEIDGKVIVKVYGDREKQNLIDEQEVKDKNKKQISVKKYKDGATTITHTYKYDEVCNDYYFVSSVIS